jgi:hypothetical protein
MTFQLLWDAVQRPVQVGRRQVESTAVNVRLAIGQTVCLRTDDALKDHPVKQLTSLRCDAGVADDSFFELGECGEITGVQGFFNAIGEANPIGMVEISW